MLDRTRDDTTSRFVSRDAEQCERDRFAAAGREHDLVRLRADRVGDGLTCVVERPMRRPTALVRAEWISVPVEHLLQDAACARMERLRGVVVEVPFGQRSVLLVIS